MATTIQDIIAAMETASEELCKPDATPAVAAPDNGMQPPPPPAGPAPLASSLGQGQSKTPVNKVDENNTQQSNNNPKPTLAFDADMLKAVRLKNKKRIGNRNNKKRIGNNTTEPKRPEEVKPTSIQSLIDQRRVNMGLDEDDDDESSDWEATDDGGGSLCDGLEYGKDPQFSHETQLKAAARRYARLVRSRNASAVVEDVHESLLHPEHVHALRVQSLQPLLSCKGPLKAMAEQGFQLARNDLQVLNSSKTHIQNMRPQTLCDLFGSL